MTKWDGERVYYECRGDARHLGARLRARRLDVAVRRPAKLRLEPRVGGPVEPVRGHDRAVRQGPLDRRRQPRPERRDRPRGLRARGADQRAVRVPEHRRPQDVHLQGPRRGRPQDRRRRAAGPAALPVPPAPAEQRHRVRPRRDRCDPAPLRRVRPGRRCDGGPRGQGHACRRPRSGSSGTRSWRPIRPRWPPRRRRSGWRSPTSRSSSSSPWWTCRRPRPSREGLAVDGRGGRPARRADDRGARLARRRTRPRRPASRSGPIGCRPRRTRSTTPSERSSAALADRAAAPRCPRPTGPAWQALIFETAKGLDLPAGRAFAALYAAFLGRASGPRAGWLLASLERTFVIDRLRAASGRAVASGEHG